MDVRWLLVEVTEKKLEDLFRLARSFPEERLTWSPEGQGRTVLDQLQECAMAPLIHMHVLNHRSWDKERDLPAFQALHAQRPSLDSLEKCERACRKNTAKLVKLIRSYPEEHLDDRVDLPFLGGISPTMAEMMLLHFWNMGYHEGQIMYIGSLLPQAGGSEH